MSLVAFGTSFASAQRQAVGAGQVVQALENHYRDAKTLTADFLERYSEGDRQERVESGRVFFARPGHMRWEYESPETKLFVSDGRILWFYVPKDHSATHQLVKQSDDWRTPLALLTGEVKLSRLCGKIELDGGPPLSDGSVVLKCWPRGETSAATHAGQQSESSALNAGDNFTEVLLEINPTSGELNDVRVEQPGGVELEFRFGAWRMNPPLASSLFEFEPLAGVAIVPAEPSSDSAP
ncbi:MAG: outer membrane lipoprotein carrier protein LolA [Candidatus Acidiferrales bacterium]